MRNGFDIGTFRSSEAKERFLGAQAINISSLPGLWTAS